MGDARALRPLLLLAVAAVVAAGCAHYPSVEDMGSVRVSTPVARDARLVTGAGAPLASLEIPGAATIAFVPDGAARRAVGRHAPAGAG